MYNREKEEKDKQSPADKVMMEVVMEIASSIEEMIEITVDFPNNHEDKVVPLIELKAWLNESDGSKIYYTFYEKPTKSPFVMTKSSAMPNPMTKKDRMSRPRSLQTTSQYQKRSWRR